MPVILVVDDFHLADDASLAVPPSSTKTCVRPTYAADACLTQPGEITLGTQHKAARDGYRIEHSRSWTFNLSAIEDSQELLERLADGAVTSPPLSVPKAFLDARWRFPLVLELLYRDWQTNGRRSPASRWTP